MKLENCKSALILTAAIALLGIGASGCIGFVAHGEVEPVYAEPVIVAPLPSIYIGPAPYYYGPRYYYPPPHYYPHPGHPPHGGGHGGHR